MPVKRVTNSQLEKSFKQIDKIFRKRTKDFEYSLFLQYKKALVKIREEMFAIYDKAGVLEAVKEGGSDHFSKLSKYNRLSALEKNIAEEIKNLTGITIDLISKEIKFTFKDSYKISVEALNKTLPFEIEFSKLNSDVIASAVKNPFDRVKWQKRGIGHHETAINQVKTEITQGLIKGEGYAQTAANITDKVNTLANNMARIVRTESHRVQVLGNNVTLDKAIAAGKKLGIELVKVWAAITDARVRDQHFEMNGKLADDDGWFTFPDGSRTELPGSSGIAAHDINCRCLVVIKLKEEEKK